MRRRDGRHAADPARLRSAAGTIVATWGVIVAVGCASSGGNERRPVVDALEPIPVPASWDTMPAVPCEPRSAVTPPKPIEEVPARYPRTAPRTGRPRKVFVIVHIGTDGLVHGAHIYRTDAGPAFQLAAAEAALRWRFEPALCDGAPMPMRIVIPFEFLPRARSEPIPEHPSRRYLP